MKSYVLESPWECDYKSRERGVMFSKLIRSWNQWANKDEVYSYILVGQPEFVGKGSTIALVRDSPTDEIDVPKALSSQNNFSRSYLRQTLENLWVVSTPKIWSLYFYVLRNVEGTEEIFFICEDTKTSPPSKPPYDTHKDSFSIVAYTPIPPGKLRKWISGMYTQLKTDFISIGWIESPTPKL